VGGLVGEVHARDVAPAMHIATSTLRSAAVPRVEPPIGDRYGQFYSPHDVEAQLAERTRRLALVSRIAEGLASSTEAEKSAVLATTDEESRTFAAQARAQTAKAEEARTTLAHLLDAGGTAAERSALAQFSPAFAQLQRVDEDILALAVENTNLKAYALTYGPATEAANAMTDALTRLADAAGESASTIPPREALRVVPLASRAAVSALDVLVMLPPHIAEENDRRMSELEAQMTRQEEAVRGALDALAHVPGVRAAPAFAAATAGWSRFETLKTQILALSRENSNVRSLDMSLNRKRAVLLACENALGAIRQAIEAEPIGSASSGRWALPR
jgi:hypothetical protein